MTAPRARRILEQLLENARLAAEDRIPLCQDTGLAIVFVELGSGVQIARPPRNPMRR
jgi:fumarate hydratase subunit alpha